MERLNAKIRSSNETQDLLLREMDARDGELETLDARLASALAGNAALNEKLDAALAMARAERVRVERLAEMLEEQAAWVPREARESHATNAIEERANEARDRGTRDRQREHERDGDPNERTVAAREVSRDERSADGGAAAPRRRRATRRSLKKTPSPSRQPRSSPRRFSPGASSAARTTRCSRPSRRGCCACETRNSRTRVIWTASPDEKCVARMVSI